jgi:hypothetical protein
VLQHLPVALSSALLTALLGAVAYFVARAKRYAQARDIATATDALAVCARAAVAKTEQSYVRTLKDPSKPGEWNETAERAAFTRALATLRATGRAHIATLEDNGVPMADRDALLETLVEEAVLTLRANHATINDPKESPPCASDSASP